MSLRVAGSIAAAALRSAEVGMAVASANVANADTDGYTRKTAQVAATDTGVGYAGVGVSSISASVNQYLLKSLVSQQSAVGETAVADDYLSRLQGVLGSTDSDSGVAAAFADAADAAATFATSPESQSARVAVTQNLAALTESLRTTSADIQDLRADADADIAATVDAINESLETLDDLNDRIVKGKAAGNNVSDLEDQRGEALKALAGNIDIQYQIDDSGRARVSTSSGAALLDSSVHALSYQPASSVSETTTFAAITLNGKDVTDKVKSGKLAGLIDLRDETLPAYQDELNQMAATFKETLNDIHNAGTAIPAPQTLTGSTTVAASDAFSGSGTLRVAIADADGAAVETQELDLSAYATVQDVADALSSMTNLTATVDADGHLVLDSGNADYGVALSGGSVGADAKGFSAYFGLNDLIQGDSAADIAVSAAISADSARLAGGVLSDATTLAAGDIALSSGDGTTASALSAAFSATQSFAAAGGLGATSATFAGYWGQTVQETATAADKAATAATDAEDYADSLSGSFLSQSGVNIDEETAAIAALESAYQAAALVLQTMQEMFDTAVGMVS
ncbi:MAG TPA: flagellar hook-associated protein FlgK [Azospirillaceae bacterium]|nr:flagellar hook-associated protein FlgK [Azospirillaceae bacterium]